MLSAILLVFSVIAVGVLHTIVPDHWLPIAVLARQRGWTRRETARAAAQAGVGHVGTTLVFGMVVWGLGASTAGRFGAAVDGIASLALIGFGLWIAYGAWRELGEGHGHSHGAGGHHHHGAHAGHDHAHAELAPRNPWSADPLYAERRGLAFTERHAHWHRHGAGAPHRHWHAHEAGTAHVLAVDSPMIALTHDHPHGTSGRTALLLVLGSSPMVEGIPAFFAASKYGVGLLIAMSIAFAVSTVATYVLLSVYGASGLQRINLGPLERYGEVASGLVIAGVGLVFGIFTLV